MSGVWDPTRADLDREGPLRPPIPERSFVVCSTPRSGSGLLCRGLHATGAGGIAAEYFNPPQRTVLADRWGCGPTAEAYARALRARRTDASGTFGLKLHYNQLQALCDDQPHERRPMLPGTMLRELVPGAVLIHVIRLDVTMQATSLWRAQRSGVWAVRGGGSERPAARTRYSYRGILAAERLIAEQELAWHRLLHREPAQPVVVVYEELVADFPAQVDRVMRAIGAPEDGPPASLDGRRQADARSRRMAARFSTERRHRRVLRLHASSALAAARTGRFGAG